MGTGSRVRRRARGFVGLGGVVGTLMVVSLEFALLTAVYQSDTGSDRRHEAWTRLDGAEASWQPGQPVTGVVAAADRLDAALDGDGGARAAAVSAAVEEWAASPDPGTWATVRSTTDALGDRLASAQRAADLRAALIHVTLLALASVGWFLWFRRVVRRQRELEHTLTEAQVVTAGQRRLTALVRNSADVVMVLEPDTTVSFASPSTRAVLGLDPDDVIGRPVDQLIDESDRPLLTGLLIRSGHGDHGVILHARHADGRALVLEGTLTNLLADDSVSGWVLTVRDVTERIALQDELTHQAMHDSLTGLANRQLFSERLSHALRRRGGQVRPLAIVFMDIDDFKHVNDSRGHGVGDLLLVEFAARVAETIREGDTAARLGGDEFAVLMEDSDLDTAHAVAERLVAAFEAPLRAGDVELPVRASVGVAQAYPGETTAEDALRNADVAMYFAKDRGKGTVAVYDSELHASAVRRLELHSELARAVQQDELVLHYQPTLDLDTGVVTGFEALVRWLHPVRGLLPPGEFVGVAEQSGLIVPIGRWVLAEACRAAATELRHLSPVMAVNVAARQLAEPGFRQDVLDALSASGLPPQRLRLEITETTLVDDRDRIVEVLNGLRALGIGVAIDDFGTGYSSLSYLADLPVDVLKVDKSFVDHVCDGGGSLVEAILALSRSLDLRTVAEGVEDPEQAAWLRAAGCDSGQGFLWSRPVVLAEARRLLHEGAAPGSLVPVDAPEDRPAELDLTAG